MSSLTLAWITETILITYRGAAGTNKPVQAVAGFPLPSQYVASFIVYGALSLIPGPNGQRVAGLFGWGVVAATFLNLWNPSAPNPVKLPKATPTPAKTA